MPYTDSDPVTEGLQLEGMWLHDPLDAEGTIYQFRYGRAARSASRDVEQEGLVFAGRRYPVVDYGEHQADEYGVRVQVHNGDDWAADLAALVDFAESRRTLHFRDNRGRAAYGTLQGHQESDETWGTTVSFTFSTVDHELDEVDA
jgi:hypothetical protein